MHYTKSLLTGLALATAPLTEAAKSTTRTSTKTVFLPQRTTGSASNIYASVITSDSSRTEYLLACQTAFSSPYNCDGDFKGVTVTYSASDLDVAFGASTYNCTLGSSAVCATKTASSANEGTTTFNPSQSSARMTAITILDVNKEKSTKTASSNSGVCKRSSGSSSSSKSSSSKNSKNSRKKSKDSCSGAPKLSWDMGVFGVLGAGLALALAL